MAQKKLRIGAIKNLEDVRMALLDVENHLQALFPDNAPTSAPKILMREVDGTVRQYTIQSGGGCTVTINSSTKTISISVP
jgi:hypothetical protein